MQFLAILVISTLVAVIVDVAARRPLDVRNAARWGLGLAFVVAGLAHLANPTPFEQHLPGWVPAAEALVALTGLLEIALGGLLAAARPDRRPAIGRLTAAYLVAVFPANVYVAVAGVDVDGQPGGLSAWIRLPLQALFVAWAIWSTAPTSQDSDRRADPATRGLMPPLPWAAGPAAPDRSEAPTVVMASVLRLRRYRDVPSFLLAALRLRSLFTQSPGAVRLSLKAIPLQRTFWTLSQWAGQDGLDEFTRDPGHIATMQRFGPRMADSSFVSWTAPGSSTPEWRDGHDRIAAARRGRSTGEGHRLEPAMRR